MSFKKYIIPIRNCDTQLGYECLKNLIKQQLASSSFENTQRGSQIEPLASFYLNIRLNRLRALVSDYISRIQ